MSNVLNIHGGAIGASQPTRDQIDPLKHGGGGGNSGGMDNASREYVDLKLEAALSRVEGKFDLLNQNLASLEARTPTWWAILGAVMIGVATILAALAFAGDRFDSGIGLADQRLEQLQRDQEQSERLEQILLGLERLSSRENP